ncbi:Nn.00g072780.m01.CDS01 [Neocucurbitaria sp. VM-36]
MARRTSPEEYQELGRRYYKLKQYEKAIDVLTQGIEAAPTLGLYDHRAATYDKLKDFNAAVKDGREMIKLDKREVKGYLRTASVLEKMEKPETALGIYRYGMKNVPVNDKNFKLLQQLHDKLARKLSPATAIDPFTLLPVELAEMVLEYLSFRNMVTCMRVSKGWKDYLAKLPKLWLYLDMSGARKPVPRSFVGNAVRRSEYRLTRLTVHRFEHIDVLKNIAKACKELTELEFVTLPHTISSTLIDIVQCASSLKRLVVHPEITTDATTQILRHHSSLEQVGFSGVKWSQFNADWKGPFDALNTLSMHFVVSRPGTQMAIGSLLHQTPRLQSLTLSNMTHLTDPTAWPREISQLPPLIHLSLKRVQFRSFPRLPPTIQRLDVDFDGTFRLHDAHLQMIQSRMPKLAHLRLWGFETLSADSLEDLLDSWMDETDAIRLLTGATALQSLSIHGILRNEDRDNGLFKGPDSLFGRSPRILTRALMSLDIATLPCDDDEIEQLLMHEMGLQSIDLSCTNITGASIKMLVDKLPSLKTIKVDNCPKINGRDAVHYAERKGVSVSCKMGEQRGGRKVKYG